MRNIKPYLEQDYEKLRAECLRSGRLFEDPLFQLNDSILAHETLNKKTKVSWKRPSEFVRDPKFIVKGIAPNDLDQGQIGDW